MFLGAEKITLAGKTFALRQVHAAMHTAHHVFARGIPMLMWFQQALAITPENPVNQQRGNYD